MCGLHLSFIIIILYLFSIFILFISGDKLEGSKCNLQCRTVRGIIFLACLHFIFFILARWFCSYHLYFCFHVSLYIFIFIFFSIFIIFVISVYFVFVLCLCYFVYNKCAN